MVEESILSLSRNDKQRSIHYQERAIYQEIKKKQKRSPSAQGIDVLATI